MICCSPWTRPLRFVLTLGVAVLLTASTAVAQSSPTSMRADVEGSEAQEGYLLADKVFAEPDLTATVVTAVTRADRVRVIPASEDGWFEVYRADSGERVGFAFRPYVSRFGPGGVTSYAPGEAPQDRRVDAPLFEVVFATVPTGTGVPHAVDTWANVRSGPGMQHPAFGVIRPDVPFQVLDVEQGWGKIRLEGESSVGYVSASLLRRIPEPASPEFTTAEPGATDAAPPSDPIREATVGGQAGGGVSEAEADEASQVEALREALSETGVDAETIVYVTRTGRKFHREGCRHLRARTFAIPLAEAMMDFSPCRTCKPLQPRDEPEE